ncbi:TraR/DksA family transcriptional regulator [Pseudoprimorskyibacter insulae]|uniref:RNA polymerase-binding transcription factor DksA n=1 Tax=Pseudoprimorskyibacter insulae TaxID=1695997 RepID=A0A2R8AZW0_9RHOB|nr:TraR/DksA C4-type zinc finger protein [Pseudoprimorskyibacter insulae]SPF81561.1 RNA polymerase-binding transcription factor DksA [Pseudoprimorskyibacter insulae]
MQQEQYERKLRERLKELGVRLIHVEAELDAPHSKDWEEMATEREGDEVLEGLGQSGLDEIERIKAALSRISAGEFGICVQCGGDISQARLEILPETPLCRDCAAKH